MAQYFEIKSGATLPILKMDVIADGRNDFNKIHYALENAKVTFSMTSIDTGIKKIAKSPALVVKNEDSECVNKHSIVYQFKERDTSDIGRYKGQFNITFDTDVIIDGKTLPIGELIVPIQEELIIMIS